MLINEFIINDQRSNINCNSYTCIDKTERHESRQQQKPFDLNYCLFVCPDHERGILFYPCPYIQILVKFVRLGTFLRY